MGTCFIGLTFAFSNNKFLYLKMFYKYTNILKKNTLLLKSWGSVRDLNVFERFILRSLRLHLFDKLNQGCKNTLKQLYWEILF